MNGSITEEVGVLERDIGAIEPKITIQANKKKSKARVDYAYEKHLSPSIQSDVQLLPNNGQLSEF